MSSLIPPGERLVKKTTKDEFMAMKALEEARKKGIAPAELDEEGKEINPHIPHYIVKAPWYVSTGQASLKHQRASTVKEKAALGIAEDDKRIKGITGVATKYRKGACENCGSMTHKAKECLDRPRAVGAKWTGEDIRPDEFIQESNLKDFEGKRDRWAGYDPDDYHDVIDTFERREGEKKRVKEDEEEGAREDALYAETADMPGQEVDLKARMTVRNLRLREDTAKYLRNLDPDSAYYDPKTRSMRENPHPDKPKDELDYLGDNQYINTGESGDVPKMQVFAWQAAELGIAISAQATPTETAVRYKEYVQKEREQERESKRRLIEKYGPIPEQPDDPLF
jgi:pre-mRNA-processing factor SLU7